MSVTWDYFSDEELKCSHCGEVHMEDSFMQKVVELRKMYGRPLIVTSAFRCTAHPIEAKKQKRGAHTYGRAIDFGVQGEDAHDLLKCALKLGFSGIGVAQKGSGRFIHVDDLTEDDGFPRPWVWSY